MKKSKIIIPAVAVLTLSVAAGITGTVAWFTATLNQSFTSSNVVVVNTDGNLGLTMANVANTNVSGNAVTLPNLMPASYDIINTKFSTVVDANVGAGNEEFKEVTTGDFITATVADKTSQNVYYAAQAKGTFSIASATESSYYLMFDATKAASFLNGTGQVFNSFRVAIEVDEVEGRKIVWGPNYEATTPIDVTNGMSYVKNDGAALTKANYNNTNCLVSSSDHYAGGASKGGIEKSITYLSSALKRTTPVGVTFTYWFEGTDKDCVSGSAGITSAAGTEIAASITMGFYAISSDILIA